MQNDWEFWNGWCVSGMVEVCEVVGACMKWLGHMECKCSKTFEV